MKLNDHQNRLWKSMIEMIDSYIEAKSSDFFGLVGNLEAALYASELSDDDLIDRWEDLWLPLEVFRAVNRNTIERSVVIKDLEKMKGFLEEELNANEYI